MTPNASNDLSKILLAGLPEVQLHQEGFASLVGEDVTDSGTMEWRAWATLHLDTDEDEENGLGQSHLNDGVSLSDMKSPGETITVLRADGLVIDLWRVRNIFDALDARSQDMANFIPMFDTRTRRPAQLAPKLDDMIEPLGNKVLIIDRVTLAPAWRGLGGVGRLLISRLIPWICGDARLVAVCPYPVELTEDEESDDAVLAADLKRVRGIWRSLGFRPYTEDIWVMDPAMSDHGRAVKNIARRLGLDPDAGWDT
ncbi:hypothetical protein CDO52_01855 [Nocardiopsis gilva YIM 90087]|uniref:Uncharacterized protein n=1 Tax=Nocardiopsis gilva YIM 90087 TaxID=1235441 RepID=A0A223S0U1_9ACTN|nr:hypothetical protein [Nocardiopsis gilva]ASU81707.1 hypothetical protein CDO52_01855 [Nocardiopsis gilva YIM 90087]